MASSSNPSLFPETRVLAIASHVVHGYVGNKMATAVLQHFNCDVSAINTVHYSNHTAYKQVRGTKTPAAELRLLWQGLKDVGVEDCDVLLTGYVPDAEAVREVGRIGRELKMKEKGVFWVLDPVMGDNGKLYIPEDEVPEYKSLLREADLILPNQFEAETLSNTPIHDLASLARAIHVLHSVHGVPHVIITSLRLTRSNRIPSSRPTTQPPTPSTESGNPLSQHASTTTTTANNDDDPPSETLTIIGSTATSTHHPRLFRIDTPLLPYFFSGTGDMFAALIVPRLLEAVNAAPAAHRLRERQSWRSPDEVCAEELPLACAVQRVLASMQAVLGRTAERCKEVMGRGDGEVGMRGSEGVGGESKDGKGVDDAERERRRHVRLMNASEVVVPRFVSELLDPPDLERFRPRRVDVDVGADVC